MQNTYEIVARAIGERGLKEVENIVYGKVGENYNSARITALSSFIDSRMFKKEIINKLCREID